ncbi:MAG: FecR domain-containing protein [Opitutaceae bacterium]|jgi:transmembrane sensor|nr:FecR domain-containing protein [Opitutaceae bacterium]
MSARPDNNNPAGNPADAANAADANADPAADSAIADDAARWVVRRDAGLSAAEEAELARWLAADARHRAAFDYHARAWSAFDGPARADAQGALVRGIAARVSRRRRRRARIAAAAAAAACAIAAFAFLPLQTKPDAADGARAAARARSSVAVTQPERRVLDDGSLVELRPGAAIEARYDDATRRIVLAGGEAHFQVAKNPARPFVVEAGGMEARAIGTAFTVQLSAEQVEILVTEGRVAVEKTPPAGAAAPAGSADAPTPTGFAGDIHAAPGPAAAQGGSGITPLFQNTTPQPQNGGTPLPPSAPASAPPAHASGAPAPALLALLGAREHLIVKIAPVARAGASAGASAGVSAGVSADAGAPPPPPTVATLTPAEINARLAWRIPLIEFSATPLAEAIALINRSPCLPDGSASARLVLAPELSALAAEPVSGIFHADNIEAFVQLLGLNLDIKAERAGDEIILRKPRR